MIRILILAIAASAAIPSLADDIKPLRLDLLVEQVKENANLICDLDEKTRSIEERLAKLEAKPAVAKPGKEPAVERDYDGAVIVPGSVREVQRSTVVGIQRPATVSVVQLAAKPVGGPVARTFQRIGQRLKTLGEMRAAIRARRTNQVYAVMARGQERLVWSHLVSEHGYRQSQVQGLTLSEALALHNLAHRPTLKISAYAVTTTVQATTVARPVKIQATYQTSPGLNCANGQCQRAGTASRSSGWYLGKNLFRAR
jgi:hypothetical protein